MALGGLLASVATPRDAGAAALADPQEVACASCHREHRGRDAQLGAMQPTQCQTCHAVALEPFAQGHPRLVDHFDPYQPRLLNFDHASHLEDYLALDDPWHSSACVLCHTPDRLGARMTLNGFEDACSECHTEDIYDDDDTDGIVFLAALDGAAAADGGPSAAIETWPPFMTFLLLGSRPDQGGHGAEADLAALEAIARGEQNPLLPETPEDINDRLARAVAQLFHDLDNREALSGRLERAAGTPLNDTEVDGLTGRLLELLPIRAAGEAWSSDSTTDGSDSIAAGNWTRLEDSRRITYRPHGHADPFMKAWYELAAPIAQRHETGVRSTAAVAIVDLLTNPDAPGQCFKCHAPHLPAVRNEARLTRQGRAGAAVMPAAKVAWAASGRTDPHRDLTRFTHAPHLGLLYGQCEQCHISGGSESTVMQLTAGRGIAAPGHGDFAPIELGTCATCHVPQRAGNDCSLCHQYHTTPAAPVLSLRADPPR